MDPRRLLGEAGATPGETGELGDEELLTAVAQRVVRMRLAVPAVFFLESSKPLSFVGSQVLVFLEPFVSAFLSVRNYQRFARLMEDRRNLETLIQRVETLDEEARAQERAEQAAAREKKRAARGAGRRRSWFRRRESAPAPRDRGDGG